MSEENRTQTRLRFTWSIGLLVGLGIAGCVRAQNRHYETLSAELRRTAGPGGHPSGGEAPELDDPARATRLERRGLIRAVLARNPSIAAARQAWRAALAEYPQVTALDDPTIQYSLAPASVGADSVPLGYVTGIRQSLPWPGKLALAGEVALAEAEAARGDYEAARLRVALMASLLFDRYYATVRSLELNREHRRLVEDIGAAARASYEAGRAPQQEPLQAELELSLVLRQKVALEARRAVVVAQINGLLHRRADLPLPPPPGHLEPTLRELDGSEALQEEALRRRPELEAIRARIREAESATDLAARRSYPDFGVVTSYNSMWANEEYRWTTGLSLNVPLQLAARRAGVEQAGARLQGARLDLAAKADEIRVEVERARQRVLEARQVVQLYRDRLLPAARAQIEAARVGYETGRGGFQALIDAERSLRNLEMQSEEALADLCQREAELEHAVGHVPGAAGEGSEP